MSGGSMNYLYSKLECGADFTEDTPERVAFAKHLKLVAKALHDIEWVDSGDYGPGDDAEAIRACLGFCAEAEDLRKNFDHHITKHGWDAIPQDQAEMRWRLRQVWALARMLKHDECCRYLLDEGYLQASKALEEQPAEFARNAKLTGPRGPR